MSFGKDAFISEDEKVCDVAPDCSDEAWRDGN